MKNFLLLSLLLCCSASFAVTPTTNMAGLIINNQTSQMAEANTHLIKNLYQWINAACENPKLLTSASLQKFFSTDIQYTVNTQLAANNIRQLKKSFKNMVTQAKRMHVVLPLDRLVVTNDSAAFSYRLNITKGKLKYTDDVIVIAKIKKGKITSWQSVSAHQS